MSVFTATPARKFKALQSDSAGDSAMQIDAHYKVQMA